jgi:hypothetical protein
MSATQAAENSQNRPKPAHQKYGSDVGAPEKHMGALRPGLRRQRGANWVPSARWGVRLASWHHHGHSIFFFTQACSLRVIGNLENLA